MSTTVSSGTLRSTYSETSKTDSSKSGLSAGEKDREEDFTKDNAASPIDLECLIQAERVTKILDEAIYKTKLAICLPRLVQEYETLRSILSAQHMDDLVFIFEQYDTPLFSTSLLNIDAMEDIKAGDLSMKNRLNPELGHLMYIMNSYPQLRPKVEEMVQEIADEYPVDSESYKICGASGLGYLRTLQESRELMARQLNTTAAEELASKLKARKLEASNEKHIAKINEYKTILKEESLRFEETMVIKTDIIRKLKNELTFVNHDASSKLKKQILDSERQMVLMSRAHAVKSVMLEEDEVDTRQGYENLLRNHLKEEKNQRARRFKVETQLTSWLQKYDTEMGDKQVELDDFAEKYEDEVQKCEKLEEQLAVQDKEYIPLMAEREKEYHQEMTEKMTMFLLEHAARVIQVAWRDVLANRLQKKKLKKLQKKMQAAAAAAAAAAEAAERKARAREKALERAAKAQAKAAKKQAKLEKAQEKAAKAKEKAEQEKLAKEKEKAAKEKQREAKEKEAKEKAAQEKLEREKERVAKSRR